MRDKLESIIERYNSIQDQMEHLLGQIFKEMQNMEITGHKQW